MYVRKGGGGRERRMRMKVRVQETRTVPEQNKHKTKDVGGGRYGCLKLNFYDHQPSSSTVGAVDTMLAAGDGGRPPIPLRFDELNPLPFGIR